MTALLGVINPISVPQIASNATLESIKVPTVRQDAPTVLLANTTMTLIPRVLVLTALRVYPLGQARLNAANRFV
jgi:hypothetical protein